MGGCGKSALLHLPVGFLAEVCQNRGTMPGYPSKKSPPVFPSDPNQPDPSVAPPRAQRPWPMKWVLLAIVVFMVVFNVYFFVFHDR